ncbi:MAG TPA: hypothetical protein VIL39_01885 [Verrucomicrobiae bacterium]
MNEDTSFPEPPRTSNLNAREQLDKLFLDVASRAHGVMHRDGRLSPTLFAVSPGGLSVYAPGPVNEAPEKNDFAAVARLICAAQAVTAVVLAVEAWVLEAKPGQRLDLFTRPSQSPDRKEYLCLCGEAFGSIYQQKLLPILRDHRDRFSCLGTSKILPPEPTAGRFANLLPQTHLNDDVRAFAALMLKSRGLVPGEALLESQLSAAARE